MSVPDWLVRKWYPGRHTRGSVEALAALAAQDHEALEESNRWLLILANKIPDANLDIANGAVYQQNSRAIKAGEDFKEKYE